MSILPELKERFRSALCGLVDDPAELLELIRRSQDPKFGDYQANFAMSLGKRLRRPPRDVAAEVVGRLDLADLCQPPEIAGPGFINLRVKDQWLIERLAAAVTDPRLGIAPVVGPRTFVVDYSAPNVAKPMHVGHIRSTVIGDALCRILRFLGHTAISDNHIGDWGTQFGMILYGYKHFLDRGAYEANPVEELARLYRLVRRRMDEQEEQEGSPHTPCADREADETKGSSLSAHEACGPPSIQAAVLAETAKLHAGDAENRRLWQEFLPYCEDEIQRMYRRLDVQFDHTLGESFYEDRLAPLVDELLARKIARHSEGAVCIFLEGQKVPMIVRKKDGAFLYGTTDLATIRYRMETWRPDAILYVVDHRQSLHFQQLFAAAGLLGYKDVELQHVSFGTVLGDDGRPFKTRSGDTVGLEGLLDEAVRRAAEIVAANDDAKPDGPELSAPERRQIAETVGIAALKYADLSQNRTSDYVFSYDKMLAMNGNTATYMQYAYARVRSIFAKGSVDVESLRTSGAPILLGSPAERALGLELLRFSEALELAVADYRPNQLTAYLFDLANRYSTFFEQCHVLRAETDQLRQSRLLLCDLTARTIQKGLDLLGIKVVEKM
jgi:arginyl-tRNA synthetase